MDPTQWMHFTIVIYFLTGEKAKINRYFRSIRERASNTLYRYYSRVADVINPIIFEAARS